MSERTLTRRLTNIDATFLYMEKPTEPAHIGGCTVYEGDLTREDVAEILSNRLHRLPRYRQRVVFPPFGLAHPTWEDDPRFDISQHIDEATLPAPGDDTVLSELGGSAYAGMLDRGRPLWKLILLRGHHGGRTAMVWKIHHAMVDGVSGVDLSMVLHDLKPDASPPAPPPVPWQPLALPGPISLLQDAVRDRLTEAAQAWTDDVFRFLRPEDTGERARQIVNSVTSSMPSLLQPAPRVPFNGPLSAERRFAWVELPFADVRVIRSVLGGTVNDVVLAIIAGGLGRYLRQHGHPTEGVQLRAMCPVSMRRADERGTLGNLVSIMIAPLHVGIADPVERLAAERNAMDQLKTRGQADGLYTLTQFANRIPPGLQAFVGQLSVPNTLLNTVSTNIPGPQIPLYLAGRRLVAWYPLGLLASDIGLFNAILSYNQTLTIAATVDPALMPDPWFYADCLRTSFLELVEATKRAGAGETTPRYPDPAP
ncbi:MAG: WS/DGAT/MGAT family O-acyltransferase, partial [Candidatus Rokuibacteriota bacterium]